jgi:hypothetical protein
MTYNIRVASLEMADHINLTYLVEDFCNFIAKPWEKVSIEAIKSKIWYFFQEEKVVPKVVLVLEETATSKIVGVLAGLAMPSFYTEAKIGIEQVWWVDPKHRGARKALLMPLVFEEWCKMQGCSSVALSSVEGSTDVSRIYKKWGYTLTEQTYQKELT